MKRPSFQWYPADWRNNANLRRCSWAAKGAWADLLGLLHDSDEYGILRWPLDEIINAVGCPAPLVRELVDKRVLKGADKGECASYIYTPRSGRKTGNPVILVAVQTGPIWYSSRLVRDEYVRMQRGNSEAIGGAPDPAPKPSPKGGLGDAEGEHPTTHPPSRAIARTSPSPSTATPMKAAATTEPQEVREAVAGPPADPPEASDAAEPWPYPAAPPMSSTREGQVAILLLGLGVQCTSDQAQVHQIAGNPLATNERIAEAVAQLRAAGTMRFGAGLVRDKIADLTAAKPKRELDAFRGWERNDELTVKLARSLGMGDGLAGESYDQLRSRIRVKLAERERQAA